jgi:hypothetical protein
LAVAVLGALVAVGPQVAANASAGAPLALAARTGGSSTTHNWAGIWAKSANYIFSGSSAQWTVPQVACPAGKTSYSNIWIGLGTGTSADPLYQTGISANCLDGVATFTDWWQEYPVDPTAQSFGKTVSPGDTIYANVTWDTSSSIELQLTDVAPDGHTNWSQSKNLADTVASLSSECILERPTVDGKLARLTDFRQARFTSCAEETARGFSKYLSPSVTIKGATVSTLTIVDSAGKTLLAVSHFTSIGGFLGTWRAGS